MFFIYGVLLRAVLFVLLFEVRLVWVDPFGAAHDKRRIVGVQAVERADVGHASAQAHSLFLLVVFHFVAPMAVP